MRIKPLLIGIIPLFLLQLILFCGCSPRPPVPYQQLQIQDSEESQGYDVYLYVAVTPQDGTKGNVESLLKWFDQTKFPGVNKMRIFVWDNPQAALMNSSGDLLGTLDVDRKKGVFELNVENPRR